VAMEKKIESIAIELKKNIIIERVQKGMKISLRGKNSILCR